MQKYWACLLTIVLVVGVVLGLQMLMPGNNSLDVWHVLAEEEHVNEKMIRHRQFQAVLQSAVAEMNTGEIHLDEAAARVHDAAKAFYPTHLSAVTVSNPGKTIHESVARNLLGHLRDHEAATACPPMRSPDLEAELADMLGLRNQQTAGLMMPE